MFNNIKINNEILIELLILNMSENIMEINQKLIDLELIHSTTID